MVRDAVRNYLALASGVSEVTRQRALAAAKALAASGGATAEQVGNLAEELLSASRANREAIAAVVKLETDRALSRLGLASAEEVAALSSRVQHLEAALREHTGRPHPGAAAPRAPRAPRAGKSVTAP